VRDSAQAHVRALKHPDAPNHRTLIVSTYHSPTLEDLAKILHEEFGKQFSIPLTVLPNILVHTYSLFDYQSWQKTGNLSKRISFDATRMKTVFRMEPIELRKTLVDTVNSLIEKGFIPKP
jgi:nucleoside-diphosphate-sugar epimerase